jgi:radical SAM/Cys-rich protein
LAVRRNPHGPRIDTDVGTIFKMCSQSCRRAATRSALFRATPIDAHHQDADQQNTGGGAEHFGIRFNHLFALTNMPIQRFGSTLVSKGTFASYMQLLRGAYRAENLDTVMCRSLLSVDWQGDLYDCDFNQMLGLRARLNGSARAHLKDLLHDDGTGAAIHVADHCYGCTAGQGSSCAGALEATPALKVA